MMKRKQAATAIGAGAADAGAVGTVAPSPTFVDLFCGCGGFTLGMIRAGFECLAAIDSDEFASAALRTNLPDIRNVLRKDLTKYRPDQLAKLIGQRAVDVVVGGPPCQGFSIARSADGANHGKRLKRDRRRGLYREFLKYVEYFQPRVFVMENVLGIRNAADGEYFTRVHNEARHLGKSRGLPGYRVHAQIEDARALGVPQKRRRQLIIGVRADLREHFLPQLLPVSRVDLDAVLQDAIGDLPILRAGSGEHIREYDLERRARHLKKVGPTGRKYLFDVLEVEKAGKLTGHVARPHSDRDLRDFARLREGESSTVAMRERKVKFEFPYDKTCFKDRYTKQSRTEPCSTIVAHMKKDGLMFIHPTQARSLTPREAARVQSFPDWYEFPESRTLTYQMIGNAVPPLVAESVGVAVASFLASSVMAESQTGNQESVNRSKPERSSERGVVEEGRLAELASLASLSLAEIKRVEKSSFLTAWTTLLSLFPEIHPDNALDHGDEKARCPDIGRLFPDGPGLKRKRYVRSGWPVAFETIGREAWRRRERGELELTEFYLSGKQSSRASAREQVRRE